MCICVYCVYLSTTLCAHIRDIHNSTKKNVFLLLCEAAMETPHNYFVNRGLSLNSIGKECVVTGSLSNTITQYDNLLFKVSEKKINFCLWKYAVAMANSRIFTPIHTVLSIGMYCLCSNDLCKPTHIYYCTLFIAPYKPANSHKPFPHSGTH